MNLNLWNTFSSTPHRLFFFSGAVQLILPILFWSLELLGRFTTIWSPLNSVIPATWAHGFVMIYGLFIFFIFGFLMTVFPRWMNTEGIKKEHYVATFIWLNMGLFIFEISLFYNPSSIFSGLLIFLTGWLFGVYWLYQCFKSAEKQNKRYELVILCSLLLGATGIASYAAWFYTDNWHFIQLAIQIGIWLYLLPLLFSVSHRMLPFFSANVIDNYKVFQPAYTLWLFILGCFIHFSLSLLDLSQWLFIVDIPLAAIALLHTVRWQIQHSFKNRLLAVLHMSFFWLFIGLSLFSIQSLLFFFNGEFILGKSPLHALTIGFFSSILIAMASRVTMGHSGRMLILDKLSWGLFLGLQLTAIFRISADLVFDEQLINNQLNLIAAGLWLICMSIWFIKYAPIYLSPSIDEQGR